VEWRPFPEGPRYMEGTKDERNTDPSQIHVLLQTNMAITLITASGIHHHTDLQLYSHVWRHHRV
jgi:hypothetical protein